MVMLSGALIVCGCEKAPEKWETQKLAWPYNPITDEYYDQAYLIVIANGERIQTNVTSLDTAANYLGQYGWEVAAVGNHVYYLKRHPQSDGLFTFSQYPLKDEYPDDPHF